MTRTYSVGDSFEVKISGGETNYTTYIRGNGELLARKDPDSSMHYYLNDHLGGTHVVLNEYGALEERTTYYPFGGVLSGGDSRFTYTGQESDKETGLMYYKARYYSPSLRRFTQPDSIIQDYYDPQSLNRYSYVYNNPIVNIDPLGHESYKFGGTYAVGAFIGGTVEVGVVYAVSDSGVREIGLYVEGGVGIFAPQITAGVAGEYSPTEESVNDANGLSVGAGGDAYTLPPATVGAEVSAPVNENLDGVELDEMSAEVNVQGGAHLGVTGHATGSVTAAVPLFSWYVPDEENAPTTSNNEERQSEPTSTQTCGIIDEDDG